MDPEIEMRLGVERLQELRARAQRERAAGPLRRARRRRSVRAAAGSALIAIGRRVAGEPAAGSLCAAG